MVYADSCFGARFILHSSCWFYSNNSNPRFIDITASGSAQVVPDAAHLPISLSSSASSNELALSQVAHSVSQVLATLKLNLIPDSQIKTTSITSSPVYSYTNNVQKITGYQASQSIDVIIRDTRIIGKVIDEVTKAGGNALQINGVSTFVYDPKKAQSIAEQNAVEHARVKAQAYALSLGVKLGKVLSLTESADSSLPTPLVAMSKTATSPTQVSLGTQDVTSNVEVRWSISR